MVWNDTQIYQKVKNRSLSNIEKNIIKLEKTPYYSINHFHLENLELF